MFEVAHARRTYACFAKAVVQVRSRAVAKVRGDCLMNRRQNLKQNEHHSDRSQRDRQIPPALNSPHDSPNCDSEQNRQHTAENNRSPPRNRQWPIGLRQDSKEIRDVVLD
jgi:hypothetical protein